MYYVEVIVADATYHKDEPLTYSCSEPLERGRIVVVPLRRKDVIGIVVAAVLKPAFTAKPVTSIPDLATIPEPLLQLLDWMRVYYPAPLGITAQLFLPGSLPKKAVPPLVFHTYPQPTLPHLTQDQRKTIADIKRYGTHILHGETGTGKTRVYIELARRALEHGQSSIILTPEIGLTSQLAQSFRDVFGGRVTVVHSGLKETERRQTWQQLLTLTEPCIVIGPRSALFSPLRNIGLIVVDESHEPAYKQDQAPYYHTTTVAAKLAALHKAPLVLGSATPLVSDYYVAQSKHLPILRMTQTAANVVDDAGTTRIVDLKDRQQFTKSPYLSQTLIDAMQTALQRHEQILLFLNRRGTARVILCEQCGWQAACPRCDLPLVYHGDQHSMRCHSCGYRTAAPNSCPECKHAAVVFRSVGTKAITEEAQRLFPEAKVKRFDTDNKKDERLEAHYESVKAGDIDIIVGTQTLAKGLDLPKLSLVGVVIADTSLYFPDFSAQERTYQLLSQVIGRVGRGHLRGTAIIQTYAPNSPLLKAILTKNWGTFYNNELTERRQFLFPPFCYVLKLTCKRASSQSAQKAAEQLVIEIRHKNHNVAVEGPAPSFHEKTQGKFTWQIILKAKHRDYLTAIVRQLPTGWTHDIDPLNLL